MSVEEIKIPKAIPESERQQNTFMPKGVNVVKIMSIDYFKDENGVKKKSKNGDYALQFTFMTENKAKKTDEFWLSKAAQYRLDDMLKAACVDNTKGEINTKAAIGKKLYMVLKEVFTLDANGNRKQKEGKNGKLYDVSYTEVLEYKPMFDNNGAKLPPPAYSEDILTEYKKDTSTSSATSKPASKATNFDQPSSQPATENWEDQTAANAAVSGGTDDSWGDDGF